MTLFVISEPDIEAAVAHLRALPLSATASMPVEWSRKRFLDTVTATLRANPKAKGVLAVGPGIWLLVQPFGVDLAGTFENDERRQVWILTRPYGTDPNRIETLAV
ncbi:hypothetical protein [Burkholderia cepacia]|uniref:hypothetical protein n=1 Tax=Burkholderia cepacia TaxID=292 RepID=UPI0026E105F3|nr:hypothetical protein [Burkholderia cepacia]MDO5947867.1 hypothetical protein [Burkholderia cepacia]